MEIKQMFLTPNKWSRPQKKMNKIKGVVIHWYANPNTSALANRNFFENRKLGKTNYGSAHYLVGQQGEVIQALPHNEISYHVGAKVYKPEALKRLSDYPNNCTIGIELAHIDWAGKMNPATYNTAVELSAKLLKESGLDEGDLWLHHEITGKDCHKWFVDNPAEWKKFKQLVGQKLKGGQAPNQKPNSDVAGAVSAPKHIGTVTIIADVWLHDKPDFAEESRTEVAKAGSGYKCYGIEGEMYALGGAYVSKKYAQFKALEHDSSKEFPLPNGILNQGDRGEGVKQLQKALNALKFNAGAVDGIFGVGTKEALRSFQSRNSLKADGIYGEQTKAVLRSKLNQL